MIMRPLTASELLDVWEQGQCETPTRRSLLVLASASTESFDELARLPIGERDGRLLALRESTFGSRLTSVATCVGCSEKLESSFDIADLIVTGKPGADSLSLETDGYEICFRLPDSLDLMAAAKLKEQTEARAVLLERCITIARRRGDQMSPGQLPEKIVEQISAQMSAADPQADIQFALQCSACGNQWQAPFDIGSFFWTEINAWAARTMSEVHILASAYGWSEQEILAMSAWRRGCYLNLVDG
jgi:hypothetical protein